MKEREELIRYISNLAEADMKKIIQHTDFPGLDVITANMNLLTANLKVMLDQQRPQQDLAQKLRSLFAFDVFQAYPSCSVLFSFSVRFRITVRITMVTAEIIPMAEASPKAN